MRLSPWTRVARLVAIAAASCLALASCGSEDDGSAPADGWEPSGTVTIVVPFAPGGGTDIMARQVAEGLQEVRDIEIRVENREGSDGAVGLTYVKQRAGDGHYLLADATTAMMLPLVGGIADLPWDDWTHLRLLATDPMLLVTAGESEWESLDDLRDAAQSAEADGEPLTMAVSAPLEEFYKALLEEALGATVEPVRFDGDGESHVVISAGDVDFGLGNSGEVLPLSESGHLKALALLSDTQAELPGFPDLESASSQGYPVAFDVYRGIMGAPELDEEIQQYWRDAIDEWTETDSYEAWITDNNLVPREEAGPEFTGFLTEWEETVETAQG